MAFDNLKLEKGLYNTGKSFTQALESIDPSENYIGTEYEGLDAYQRQLKRFDIKISGDNSDTISKFFNTTDSATLFPEYISRAVKQGIAGTDVVDRIVSTTTKIDSLDYRSIQLEEDPDVLLNDVAEGAKIPESVIKTKDNLTSLHKRGRMLVSSYEAIKFQKLDLFTIALKRIGKYISYCQVADFMNSVTSVVKEPIHYSVKCTYDVLLQVWDEMRQYDMNTIVTGKNITREILAQPEFRDSNAGLNFHGTGKMITPLGAELISVPILNGFYSAVCFDKNYAFEKVQVGDVITDFDKIIDHQLERATVTTITGFNCICEDAFVLAMKG